MRAGTTSSVALLQLPALSGLTLQHPAVVMVLAAALAALVGDLAWLVADVQLGQVMWLPVLPSMAFTPALLVAWWWLRPVECQGAWWLSNVTMAAALAVLIAWQAGPPVLVRAEFAVASMSEEVVYRVALPLMLLVAVAGTRRLAGQRAGGAGAGRDGVGVQVSPRLLAGVLVASGALFIALPGHVAQIAQGGLVPLVAFLLFTFVWTAVVWSSGALGSVALSHALVNVAGLVDTHGSGLVHTAATLLALVALTAGMHRQQRRLQTAGKSAGQQAGRAS